MHHLRFGQGKEIVFLHGWGGSSASFYQLALELSANYTVTLVDFYGFGQTPHPDKPLTLGDYVDGLIELISDYKMEDVVLVGHSFGGRVAVKAAAKYGWLFRKIVLVDAAGLKPRRGFSYYFKIYTYKLKRKLGLRAEGGSADYRTLSPVMRETFKNVVNEDLFPYLRKVTMPVLLFWGAKDKDTPLYMAKRFQRGLSDAVLKIAEGAGHFSYLEEPSLFFSELSDFLEVEP